MMTQSTLQLIICIGATALAMLAGCTASNHKVRLTVNEDSPALVEYSDGDGSWQPALRKSAVEYELDVSGDYRVITICYNDDGTFETEELRATIDDGDPAIMLGGPGGPGGCWGHRPTGMQTVHVSGEMMQPGVVLVGSQVQSSETGPWEFGFDLYPDRYDVIAADALGAVSRVLILRDQVIDAQTTIPTLDLDADGIPTLQAALTISGEVSSAEVGVWNDLQTSHGDVPLTLGTDASVNYLPPSVLSAGDAQSLWLTSSTLSGVFQSAYTPFDGSETNFAFLPVPDIAFQVDAAGVNATWSTLPPGDAVELAVTSRVSPAYQRVVATRNWLEATGASALSFESAGSASGYESVDLTQSYSRSFSIDRDDGPASYATVVTQIE